MRGREHWSRAGERWGEQMGRAATSDQARSRERNERRKRVGGEGTYGQQQVGWWGQERTGEEAVGDAWWVGVTQG